MFPICTWVSISVLPVFLSSLLQEVPDVVEEETSSSGESSDSSSETSSSGESDSDGDEEARDDEARIEEARDEEAGETGSSVCTGTQPLHTTTRLLATLHNIQLALLHTPLLGVSCVWTTSICLYTLPIYLYVYLYILTW